MRELQFEEMYSLAMRCLWLNRAHPGVPLDRRWALLVGLMHGQFTLLLFSFFYSMADTTLCSERSESPVSTARVRRSESHFEHTSRVCWAVSSGSPHSWQTGLGSLLILCSMFVVDLKRRDFSRACANGIFITVWSEVTFMYAIMLIYRDYLVELIRINQEHFDAAAEMPPEKQAVVRRYAERGRWVTKVWFWSCTINCGLFPIKALVLTLLSLYKGEFHLVPWFDCSWPSPIEEHKYEPLVFSIIFYFHIEFGCYAILMYIGFCPLGPIFILNACARLELMIADVKTVFNVEPYDKKEVSKQVAQIVIKIQDMYSYVKLINDMSRLLYEVNMKGSAVMIPVALYQVLDALKRGEFDIEYPTFVLTAALLCYVPCYYSDLLMEKGEELRMAIYKSGWEAHYDRGARSCVLLMLTVAARPISINTMFRTMCLDAFTSVCHDAYAIFSLINAMWD